MILEVILLIVGLILLVKGSDYFVKSASALAKNFGVSEFIIGLTLVAIGTSLPELGASIVASLRNEGALVIGTVVGSNISNLSLIAGITALFASVKISKTTIKRDGYMMIFTKLIFFVAIATLFISRIVGAIFLALYVLYMFFLLDSDRKKKEQYFKGFVRYVLKFGYLQRLKEKSVRFPKTKKLRKKKIWQQVFILIFSGIAIFFGADLIVKNSVFIATSVGISKTIVGLTVIALGTSLPELGVSISAARKGKGEMVLGNLMGSSIANLLLIVGISALISPINITRATLYLHVPVMLATAIIFVGLLRKGWTLKRKEGILLLLVYIAFIIGLVFF